MHKKVYAVYFLLSKGQHEEGQKALRVDDTPISYVYEKKILLRDHKYQSASASDGCDSSHRINSAYIWL